MVDDLCMIRSMHGDMVVHSAAQYQMMTGRVIPGFPAMGSWMVYGLGSEAESLPAYVVMPDPAGAQEAGLPMYTHGFLPAVYQPTFLRPGRKPVLNLDLPKGVSLDERRQTIDLIRALERGESSGRGPRVRGAHLGLRHRVQDADRGAGSLRHLEGIAGDARDVRRRRAEDGRLRPALPAGAADGREGRAVRRAWCRAAARRTPSGTRTATSRPTTSRWRRRPTSRSPR